MAGTTKKKKQRRAPRKGRRSRDLERSRAEILKVTFREVYRRGFQGVSVDEIVQQTALTKGALYHQFPTKLELGYALVEEVIQPMIIERWIRPLDAFENPLEGILRQLEKLIGDRPMAELRLGCPLNNLVQEMAPVDPGFRKRLNKALTLWIEEMDLQLIRAQKAGHLKPDANTREVAHFVVMAHEGFYGMIKGLGEAETFSVLFRSLLAYFATISKPAHRSG